MKQKPDALNQKDYIANLILLALGVWFALFFIHEQQFTNLDQAKLVRYGEVIWEQKSVFTTNLFSYTHPDHPFINHHWGAGVVFYALHQWFGGLGALTIAGMLLNLAAFLFILFHVNRFSNKWVNLLCAFFLLPLMASRLQPRPEDFSILFFVLNSTMLYVWYNGMLKRKFLWVLPAIQLLWVNIHILFFLGLFLQGTILLQLLITKEKRHELRFFAMVFFAGVVASFINPAFHKGVFYPLMIMGEIQYAVTENANFFKTHSSMGGTPRFIYYELALFLALPVLYYWIKNPREALPDLYVIIWLLAFTFLFIYRIRANVFYAYMLLLAFAHLSGKLKAGWQRNAKRAAIAGMLVLLLPAVFLRGSPYDPYHQGHFKPGIGVDPKMAGGAEYIRNFNIKGPVFNNFDIGDYLIYHLYPDWEVFVDSRPEAYPPEFFSEKLLPAFYGRDGWLTLSHEYRFNVVFLGFHSQVLPLVRHLYEDDGWFMAYNDDYTIIFLRRGPQNDHLVRHTILQRRKMSEIVRNFQRSMERYRFY